MKARVLAKYPDAKCRRAVGGEYWVVRPYKGGKGVFHIGSANSAQAAWRDAARRLKKAL